MSFNRYIQLFSDIAGIYQQRIIKLKESSLGREGKKEGGKNKNHAA